MNHVETGWAGGLFEGEGTITRCNGRARLAVKMTNEISVRRFGDAVGAGRVYGPYGPYRSQLGSLPYWLWVAERDDARAVAFKLMAVVSEPFASRLADVIRSEEEHAVAV